MTSRRLLQIGALIALVVLVSFGVGRLLEWMATPDAVADDGASAPAPPAADVPHITATLFYASVDGQSLVRASREVPLASGAVPQGREILATLLQPPPVPYVSVIPQGTTLRAFYVSDRGDAFVDLSTEASTNHQGGSFAEILTVYAVVNTVTTNLPTIQRVQILIGGKEADTLAGHVDLRRPLTPDLSIVRGAVAAAP